MSILAKILADKEPEVARAKQEMPVGLLKEKAKAREIELPCLATALRRESGQEVRIIAEFKRASPSAGCIRADVAPEEVCKQYEKAGASAISVLTDVRYFDGKLEFLERVQDVVDIPVLRKDFIVDSYQLWEAKAFGADAVLLIVSALEQAKLLDFYEQVRGLGMRALVEVHSEKEAERAAKIGAEIIGVNHRNLATFEVDLELTGRLSGLLGKQHILVGESGIRDGNDIKRLGLDGAHAVLIGETLMRAEHPGKALEALRRESL